MSSTESPEFLAARASVQERLASSGADSPAAPSESRKETTATAVVPEGALPSHLPDPAPAVPDPAASLPRVPEAANGGGSTLPAIFHGSPGDVVAQASAVAKVLASVIARRKLYVTIHDKAYVFVEAWTFCGSMLGVFPVVEWTREIPDGWEARCRAQTLSGATVGAAEAQCTRKEAKWKDRDGYALRSMAQTRAVSKAMRLPLGFIVQLAGYNPTPAEEMNGE